jgi:hypothetical protein
MGRHTGEGGKKVLKISQESLIRMASSACQSDGLTLILRSSRMIRASTAPAPKADLGAQVI